MRHRTTRTSALVATLSIAAIAFAVLWLLDPTGDQNAPERDSTSRTLRPETPAPTDTGIEREPVEPPLREPQSQRAHSIHGTIVDHLGQPLPGLTFRSLVNNQEGQAANHTDIHGGWSLRLAPHDDTQIQFEFGRGTTLVRFRIPATENNVSLHCPPLEPTNFEVADRIQDDSWSIRIHPVEYQTDVRLRDELTIQLPKTRFEPEIVLRSLYARNLDGHEQVRYWAPPNQEIHVHADGASYDLRPNDLRIRAPASITFTPSDPVNSVRFAFVNPDGSTCQHNGVGFLRRHSESGAWVDESPMRRPIENGEVTFPGARFPTTHALSPEHAYAFSARLDSGQVFRHIIEAGEVRPGLVVTLEVLDSSAPVVVPGPFTSPLQFVACSGPRCRELPPSPDPRSLMETYSIDEQGRLLVSVTSDWESIWIGTKSGKIGRIKNTQSDQPREVEWLQSTRTTVSFDFPPLATRPDTYTAQMVRAEVMIPGACTPDLWVTFRKWQLERDRLNRITGFQFDKCEGVTYRFRTQYVDGDKPVYLPDKFFR